LEGYEKGGRRRRMEEMGKRENGGRVGRGKDQHRGGWLVG
jgi:hypothetical protein